MEYVPLLLMFVFFAFNVPIAVSMGAARSGKESVGLIRRWANISSGSSSPLNMK